MKKSINLFLCCAFCMLLLGCQYQREKNRITCIEFAQGNKDELISCAEELVEQMSVLDDPAAEKRGFRAYQLRYLNDSLQLWMSAADVEMPYDCDAAANLLTGGIVRYISFHANMDGTQVSVVFSCAGFGIGSATTYYDIQYVPSCDARDLWWYQTTTYEVREKGFYGEMNDNQFYYVQIADGLYYTEASF